MNGPVHNIISYSKSMMNFMLYSCMRDYCILLILGVEQSYHSSPDICCYFPKHNLHLIELDSDEQRNLRTFYGSY